MAAHKDLRDFLAAIEASGDLVTIDDQVDWDQELAGIGRLSCERYGPAFMFNNIKDYPGWRTIANPVAGWRRYAVGLGLRLTPRCARCTRSMPSGKRS